MSLYDYEMSREIQGLNYPFYALIMVAMRQADSDNIEKLKSAFPDVWKELKERYNARGGLLDSEKTQ